MYEMSSQYSGPDQNWMVGKRKIIVKNKSCKITFYFLLNIQCQCFILSFLHGSLIRRLLLHKDISNCSFTVTVWIVSFKKYNSSLKVVSQIQMKNVSNPFCFVHLYSAIFYFSILNVLVSNKLPKMSEQEAYNINLFWTQFLLYLLHSNTFTLSKPQIQSNDVGVSVCSFLNKMI